LSLFAFSALTLAFRRFTRMHCLQIVVLLKTRILREIDFLLRKFADRFKTFVPLWSGVPRQMAPGERNKVWHPMFEPKVFRCKCTALKKVIAAFLGLFGAPSDSVPGALCPPHYAPASVKTIGFVLSRQSCRPLLVAPEEPHAGPQGGRGPRLRNPDLSYDSRCYVAKLNCQFHVFLRGFAMKSISKRNENCRGAGSKVPASSSHKPRQPCSFFYKHDVWSFRNSMSLPLIYANIQTNVQCFLNMHFSYVYRRVLFIPTFLLTAIKTAYFFLWY